MHSTCYVCMHACICVYLHMGACACMCLHVGVYVAPVCGLFDIRVLARNVQIPATRGMGIVILLPPLIASTPHCFHPSLLPPLIASTPHCFHPSLLPPLIASTPHCFHPSLLPPLIASTPHCFHPSLLPPLNSSPQNLPLKIFPSKSSLQNPPFKILPSKSSPQILPSNSPIPLQFWLQTSYSILLQSLPVSVILYCSISNILCHCERSEAIQELHNCPTEEA